jgi:hypothetical protein
MNPLTGGTFVFLLQAARARANREFSRAEALKEEVGLKRLPD